MDDLSLLGAIAPHSSTRASCRRERVLTALLIALVRRVLLVVLHGAQVRVVLCGVKPRDLNWLLLLAEVHSLNVLSLAVAHSRVVTDIEISSCTLSTNGAHGAAWSARRGNLEGPLLLA